MKEESPTQLPLIVFRIPHPSREAPDMYGYAEVHVPIRWEDFKGTAQVRKIAKAGLNISNAIRDEMEKDLESRQEEITKKKAVEKEKKEAEEKEQFDTDIAKFIKDNPDEVMAKRKEVGPDVLNEEAAAAILIRERKTGKKASSFKTADKAPKATSTTVDYGSCPPMGGNAKKIRFYRGQYGWSVYPYTGDIDDLETTVTGLFEWLISIPMELRHRRTKKYPAISNNGKYIMVNEYEKEFIESAADAQGIEVDITED